MMYHEDHAGSNAWRRVPDLPEGRHGMGAVTAGNVIYVPGGGSQNGVAPSARAFAFVVTQTDPLPFEQWARGFFSSADPASGPNDDFDGDGLTNFEEFALNLDPGVLSAKPRPRLRRGGTNQFFLEYERGRSRAVKWNLLMSTNLAQWNLAAPAIDWQQIAATDLGLGAERVTIEIFPRNRDGLFLRLKPGLP